MTRPVFFLLLASAVGILFGTPCVAAAQAGGPVVATGELLRGMGPFDGAAREILETTGAPGAALAVAKGGRLVLVRGYGYADAETRDPVEPDARFRVASVSKPVTAAAVLRLVEQGRLTLEAPVTELLGTPEPGAAGVDARVHDITVGDLLYHAGGWDRGASGIDPPFLTDRIALALDEPPPATAGMIVRFMLGQPLDFDPGARQVYSNLGYAVLGRIVEAVTGEAYGEHVRRTVLEPAGARGMALARSLAAERRPGEVRYHDPRRFFAVFPGLGMVPAPYGAFAIEAMDAHGGWIASTLDLVRFAASVDGDPVVPDILRPETVAAMTEPHPAASGDSTYLGMGWEVVAGADGPRWFHRGDLPGSTALLIRDGDRLIAFLMNGNAGSRENAERILTSLLAASTGVEAWPAGEPLTRR